ncbi:unnamed protein product [Ascophyllum nodosum]
MDLVVLVRSRVVRCRQWLAYPSAAVQRLKCSQRRYPCQPLGALPGISRNHAIASSGKVSGGEVSKRKQFKQVAVDPKVIRHLDALGLGLEKKKLERGRKLRLYRRGAVSSAAPGPTSPIDKPKTFDHPTWAVKKLASATTINEIPPPQGHLPEVAIVGRSNVGKSTLLNALVGLKKHPHARASVSDTPGETRSLDFFRLGTGKRAKLVLADMPGYGFAYAQQTQREDWKGLMMAYLRGRGTPLKRVMLLLDARHGFKKLDIEFLEILYDPKGPSPLGKYRPPKIQILLTKCDLVKRVDLARRVAFVRHQLDEVSRRQTNLPTMMLSALKGRGLVELQRELASLDPAPGVVDSSGSACGANDVKNSSSGDSSSTDA